MFWYGLYDKLMKGVGEFRIEYITLAFLTVTILALLLLSTGIVIYCIIEDNGLRGFISIVLSLFAINLVFLISIDVGISLVLILMFIPAFILWLSMPS